MREPKTLLGISVAFLRSCRCFTTVVQDNSLCTCDENYYGTLIADGKAMEKFTLVMRAIIWHAPKYMKKCESEEVNGD